MIDQKRPKNSAERRNGMTKIRDTSDPILFPTEANENKTEKKRAGKGIVIVIGAIAVMAFVVYLTAITIATTQS
ncbi:hypothetical protein SZ54_0328 [Rhizobium sp. UR51a]|nr:hypothetical protein SZ54_0328 [Rhizobium sp. UR51a]